MGREHGAPELRSLLLVAHYSIVPNAMFLWTSESVELVVEVKLQQTGLLTAGPCDYPHTVVKHCLEAMEAISFKGMSVTESGQLIAGLLWDNIAFIKMDTTVGHVSTFRSLVDVERRHMVEATIDGQPDSAMKVAIWLWFDTVLGHACRGPCDGEY